MKPAGYAFMALFAATADAVAPWVNAPLAKKSCLPTLAAMKAAPALILLLLTLSACSVAQSQPAPVTDDDRWGHLPPDPERPQQADRGSSLRG